MDNQDKKREQAEEEEEQSVSSEPAALRVARRAMSRVLGRAVEARHAETTAMPVAKAAAPVAQRRWVLTGSAMGQTRGSVSRRVQRTPVTYRVMLKIRIM